MDLSALLLFNLAIMGAPGPAVIAMMRSSFSGEGGQGLACGLGLAAGATFWGMSAVLGLNSLFAIAPWSYAFLKIAAAFYLIWLAFRLWRSADKIAVADTPTGFVGFWFGVMTNMANPKAVFFIGAIFTTVFAKMPAGLDAVIVLTNHFLLEALFYCALAVFLSHPAMRRAYLRCKQALDRISAGVLGVMALRLVN